MDGKEQDLKARDIFYDYYVKLTNILGHDSACLLPGLIQERIINTDDQVVIESIASPQAKAGKLLQTFSGPLEAGNKDSFVKLLQIMVNNGKATTQTLAKEILEKLGIEPLIVPRKVEAVSHTTSITNTMKPDLKDVLNWVVPQAADKWEKICVQLIGDEHRHIVATIRKDIHGSEDCCHKMFEEWLSLYKDATWQDIINALQSGSVRKIALAEELIERLTTRQAPPSTGQLVSPRQQQHHQQYDSQQMVTSNAQQSKVSQSSQESNDLPDGQKPADIQPQAALTLDCGKGTVTDAVFTDIKKTVCRIHAPQMVATGFVTYVKSKEGFNMALVTNNHVIKTAEDAMASRIAFENVFPDHKVTLKGFQIFFKEKDAFRCSPETELDYTIIEIDENKMKDPETGKRLDIEPIYLMYPADIRTDDQVYVIQHPRGGKLAFSSSQCTVVAPLLLYECTTEMGSSGSPVLKEVDGDLKIVALHRGGKDKQWDCGGYNCGTLIQQIVNHLNGQQCLRLPTRNELQQAPRGR